MYIVTPRVITKNKKKTQRGVIAKIQQINWILNNSKEGKKGKTEI